MNNPVEFGTAFIITGHFETRYHVYNQHHLFNLPQPNKPILNSRLFNAIDV